MIILATQCLRECGYSNISLYIPYFLGGRSDRKFEHGSVNYIKSVISPIINSQKYNHVYVLDPHSDVIEACINNFVAIDNTNIVKEALMNLTDNVVFVSSDGGSLKKIYNLVSKLGPTIRNGNYPIIIGNKHRENGKIVSTSVPDCEKYFDSDYVIVDDICDGGRTFIEVAKIIKNGIDSNKGKGKIYLVVAHGIFSAGFEELSKYFTKIWTTNSIRNIEPNKLINQINIL